MLALRPSCRGLKNISLYGWHHVTCHRHFRIVVTWLAAEDEGTMAENQLGIAKAKYAALPNICDVRKRSWLRTRLGQRLSGATQPRMSACISSAADLPSSTATSSFYRKRPFVFTSEKGQFANMTLVARRLSAPSSVTLLICRGFVHRRSLRTGPAYTHSIARWHDYLMFG